MKKFVCFSFITVLSFGLQASLDKELSFDEIQKKAAARQQRGSVPFLQTICTEKGESSSSLLVDTSPVQVGYSFGYTFSPILKASDKNNEFLKKHEQDMKLGAKEIKRTRVVASIINAQLKNELNKIKFSNDLTSNQRLKKLMKKRCEMLVANAQHHAQGLQNSSLSVEQRQQHLRYLKCFYFLMIPDRGLDSVSMHDLKDTVQAIRAGEKNLDALKK